jgi:hypothetical protein
MLMALEMTTEGPSTTVVGVMYMHRDMKYLFRVGRQMCLSFMKKWCNVMLLMNMSHGPACALSTYIGT